MICASLRRKTAMRFLRHLQRFQKVARREMILQPAGAVPTEKQKYMVLKAATRSTAQPAIRRLWLASRPVKAAVRLIRDDLFAMRIPVQTWV